MVDIQDKVQLSWDLLDLVKKSLRMSDRERKAQFGTVSLELMIDRVQDIVRELGELLD